MCPGGLQMPYLYIYIYISKDCEWECWIHYNMYLYTITTKGTDPSGLVRFWSGEMIGVRLFMKPRVIDIHTVRYYGTMGGVVWCEVYQCISGMVGRLKKIVRRQRKMVWLKPFTTQKTERESIVANHTSHTLGVPSGVSTVVKHEVRG